MKLRHALIPALLLLGISAAQAAPLSPEEALSAATQHAGSSKLRAQARKMQLAATETDPQTGTPTLYIFAAPDKADGFMVVAADDCARTLVPGYSDDTAFDAANIPPAMQWWLRMVSARVSAEAAAGGALVATTLQPGAISATPPTTKLKATPKAAREIITPMLKTQWDQGAPFNDLCPVLGDKRAVTGCVATAAAQIMKYHEYPAQGIGSKTYSYTYGSATETASANFGATTYDWDNMLNIYTSSATAEQNDAVATLMYHCGVAAGMKYSPEGSGASDIDAAMGLIEYFGYDKALRYAERLWYTETEWDELIYEQLAAGLPVMYCGTDGTSGHAFVCDGYNRSGLYHINWGWSGGADGYFELTDLNPYTQGIGGGSGKEGFNYNQSVLVGVRPAEEGSEYCYQIATYENLATSATIYPVSRSNHVVLTGVFYNMSVIKFAAELGVQCEGEGISQFLTYGIAELDPFHGITDIEIATTAFPEGDYDVYPAFRDESGEVHLIHTPIQNGDPGHLQFHVTSTVITVGDAPAEEAELSAAFKTWWPDDSKDTTFFAGHSYNFSFELTSTAAWENEVYLVVFDDSYALLATSDPVEVSFAEAGTRTDTYHLEIPADIEPGKYRTCLGYIDGDGMTLIKPIYTLPIAKETGTGRVTEFIIPDCTGSGTSIDDPYIIPAENQEITVRLECTKGPWEDGIALLFADPATFVANVSTESTPVSLEAAGDTTEVTFRGPWEQIEIDTNYVIAIFGDAAGQISEIRYIMIRDTASAPGITATDGPTEYYNLQGIRVDNPGAGIYLRRQGSSVSKVRL